MSWYTGTFASTAAGSLIAVLDAKLPLNAKWSIWDAAAGTNEKVYECKNVAENCLFYVLVKDNNVGYAEIELWEGWNAATHVGVGANIVYFTVTNVMRINRPAGGWSLSVLNHRFIFIDDLARGSYCGQPLRYDTAKNIVLFAGEGSGTSKYNPLGIIAGGTNSNARFLFDDGGGQNLGKWDNEAASKNTRIKGIDGAHRVIESHICNVVTGLIVGVLDGVMTTGITANGFARFDVVTVDGVDWMAINGDFTTKYWALVRKS